MLHDEELVRFQSDEVKRAKVPRPALQPALLINLEHRTQHSVVQNEFPIARRIMVVITTIPVVFNRALYVISIKGDILADLSGVAHCCVLADGFIGPDVGWSKRLFVDDRGSAILVIRSRMVSPGLLVVTLLRLPRRLLDRLQRLILHLMLIDRCASFTLGSSSTPGRPRSTCT